MTAETAAHRPEAGHFRYGLNTSTLRGQKLSLVEEIDIAAQAGYDAVEPWVEEIDRYVQAGGSLADLNKRIHDRGMTVENLIGFFDWIGDDAELRAKGLEEARRNMDLAAQLDCKYLAAPPTGSTERTDLNLLQAAERYRTLLELSEGWGVVPMIEVWGFSKTLNRLGEAALIAIESGHPQACILTDVYHLYKGGSGHSGLKLLQGKVLPLMHMNDYPANPSRDTITDADRVYPGDGVAPLTTILRDLRAIGFQGALSLELFNEDYWKQDALSVARTGLEKMRAAVQKSL